MNLQTPHQSLELWGRHILTVNSFYFALKVSGMVCSQGISYLFTANIILPSFKMSSFCFVPLLTVFFLLCCNTSRPHTVYTQLMPEGCLTFQQTCRIIPPATRCSWNAHLDRLNETVANWLTITIQSRLVFLTKGISTEQNIIRDRQFIKSWINKWGITL